MTNPSKGGTYYLIDGVHVPAEEVAKPAEKIDANPAPDTGTAPDSTTETAAKE